MAWTRPRSARSGGDDHGTAIETREEDHAYNRRQGARRASRPQRPAGRPVAGAAGEPARCLIMYALRQCGCTGAIQRLRPAASRARKPPRPRPYRLPSAPTRAGPPMSEVVKSKSCNILPPVGWAILGTYPAFVWRLTNVHNYFYSRADGQDSDTALQRYVLHDPLTLPVAVRPHGAATKSIGTPMRATLEN